MKPLEGRSRSFFDNLCDYGRRGERDKGRPVSRFQGMACCVWFPVGCVGSAGRSGPDEKPMVATKCCVERAMGLGAGVGGLEGGSCRRLLQQTQPSNMVQAVMEALEWSSPRPRLPALTPFGLDPAVQSWTMHWSKARFMVDRLRLGPASLEELVAWVRISPVGACRLLHNLASCGVVSREDELYQLGPATREGT